jgi:hypothetical protein
LQRGKPGVFAQSSSTSHWFRQISSVQRSSVSAQAMIVLPSIEVTCTSARSSMARPGMSSGTKLQRPSPSPTSTQA